MAFKADCSNANNNKLIKSVSLLFDALISYSYKNFFNPLLIKDDDRIIYGNMKGCYLATSVVAHYQPYSIDYFMMNLTSVAPYEFTGVNNTNEIKNNIHIYTKYIIADILMSALKYAYHGRSEDSYLKRLLWRLLEYANFYEKTLEEFLFESVTIINFNYDLSLILMLMDYLHLDSVNDFLKEKRFYGVYGALFIKNKDKIKYMFEQQDIWRALFKINPNDGFLLVENLEQIKERITWIGEDKEDELKSRPKLQKAFIDADEVYLLGFGFDINNLYNLGLINKGYKLEDKLTLPVNNKKILVSGGNEKIISILTNIFDIKSQDVINNLYHLKGNKLDIYISQKLLPEALITDI